MSQENPLGQPSTSTAGGAMSERMQALLSRAAEEQLNEQRQVSAVLLDLRHLVADLSEQLRDTASSERLDSLGTDVAALTTELRMSTAGLGERLDTLGRRVDERAEVTLNGLARSGSGADALSARVGTLSNDLAAQVCALDRLVESLSPLSEVPAELSTLHREVEALSGQVASVEQLRASLRELGADAESRGQAMSERLDRFESASSNSAVTAGALEAAVAPVLSRLEEVGASGPVLERLDGMDASLDVLRERFDVFGDRLGVVGETAGGVPAVAAGLARVAVRLEELGEVRGEVAAVRTAVSELASDTGLGQLQGEVAALRQDVEQLGGTMSRIAVPTTEAVAAAVAHEVMDRLAGELAPQVSDLVLSRLASRLGEQVAGNVTASVYSGLTERLQTVSGESERRINAHVDEAVLVLAEALLRRRRSGRGTATSVIAGLVEPAAGTPASAPVDSAPVDSAPVDPTPADSAPEQELPAQELPQSERAEAEEPAHDEPVQQVQPHPEPGVAPEPLGTDDPVLDDLDAAADDEPAEQDDAAVDDELDPEADRGTSSDETDGDETDGDETDGDETDGDETEVAAPPPRPSQESPEVTGTDLDPSEAPSPSPRPPNLVDSSRAPLSVRNYARPAVAVPRPVTDPVAPDRPAAASVAELLKRIREPLPSTDGAPGRETSAPPVVTSAVLPDSPPASPASASPAAGPSAVPDTLPPVDESFDEDDEDGPRRRPWWRPGG